MSCRVLIACAVLAGFALGIGGYTFVRQGPGLRTILSPLAAAVIPAAK